MDDVVDAGGVGKEAGTHHERILRALHQKIVSQEWAPGFRLPYETELADSYGVSRMTMNKVLTRLTREGYLVRKRKLGTFVAEPRAQAAVLEIHDIEAEVRRLGADYSFALGERELRPPTPEERCEARIPDGGDVTVLFLSGVHAAGAMPFCLESRIINPAAAPNALDQDFRRLAPGQWLLREVPWTAAEHRIRAINADRRTARLLDVPIGEACLEIWRRTELAGNWVTVSRQVYPGSRHQLRAKFEPGST
ncbi:MAG: histidine utilization repressor [Amaricoccus sp.]